MKNTKIKDEGRRKREEGRRKREEGRRKKGRRKKEEGRRKKEEGRFFQFSPSPPLPILPLSQFSPSPPLPILPLSPSPQRSNFCVARTTVSCCSMLYSLKYAKSIFEKSIFRLK
ncbi:hypothetical protein [Microcoleus sp. CAWBG51]|uniref:hypothetical protein n=1 Tax=Microcoleus sp. CAWBG51 TaxID=2841648 RepID=UPI0025D028A6|nr:hypothetical protein [Microcoleus sp. CAWBG51]